MSDRNVRIQHISATDHPKGMAQKAAFDKHLGSQGLKPREIEEKKNNICKNTLANKAQSKMLLTRIRKTLQIKN